MTLRAFNQLEKKEVLAAFLQCCGAKSWGERMSREMPFASIEKLINKADFHWYESCGEEDWLEAFTHHPRIGDLASLEKKFATTSHLAGEEQAGVNEATKKTIVELAEKNEAYFDKFGFIFIICATGKSAEEMLCLLKDRLGNRAEEELRIAMGEQQKITLIRLQKLLSEEVFSLPVSQLTTHVLDTSLGIPGEGMTIRLQSKLTDTWTTIAQGITNADGRISDLLPAGRLLDKKAYRMIFETGNYFIANEVEGFYPEVSIIFSVKEERHYHVPLLINPFGYSTYRGS